MGYKKHFTGFERQSAYYNAYNFVCGELEKILEEGEGVGE